MKKVFYLVSILALITSCCSKQEAEESSIVNVTFGYKLVSEVPMTKAVVTSDINTWIEESLPQKISLKLVDANGTKYNIETGTSVALPVGIYTVTGKNTPTMSASVIGSDVYFSVLRPSIAVNTSIEVTYTQTNYVVPATYTAFGIVIDGEETSSASFQSSHGEQGNIEFAEIGSSGIVFVNGNLGTYTLDMTLTPVSSGDEVTTHRFQSTYSSTAITPTFGNYYIIHPKGISSVDGGNFSYSIGAFRAVDIEND